MSIISKNLKISKNNFEIYTLQDCPWCDISARFWTIEAIRKHVLIHHPNNCIECLTSFSGQEDFEFHVYHNRTSACNEFIKQHQQHQQQQQEEEERNQRRLQKRRLRDQRRQLRLRREEEQKQQQQVLLLRVLLLDEQQLIEEESLELQIRQLDEILDCKLDEKIKQQLKEQTKKQKQLINKLDRFML
jgi:flagellar biosynthesis GTPase FlhF